MGWFDLRFASAGGLRANAKPAASLRAPWHGDLMTTAGSGLFVAP
jgi:hypothetical protein